LTTTGKGTIVSVRSTYVESSGMFIAWWPNFPAEEVGLYYNFTDPLGNNYTDRLGHNKEFIDAKSGSILEYRINEIVTNGSKTYALNRSLTTPTSPITAGLPGQTIYLRACLNILS
jgi:hypothetical protein